MRGGGGGRGEATFGGPGVYGQERVWGMWHGRLEASHHEEKVVRLGRTSAPHYRDWMLGGRGMGGGVGEPQSATTERDRRVQEQERNALSVFVFLVHSLF